MKKTFLVLAIVAAATAGCNNNKKSKPTTDTDMTSVLDVGPASQYPAAPVVSQPVIQDPFVSQTPAASTPTASSGTYTVKKGDTLYGIARTRYGDGKQWTKIASANPGVTPQSLKVGQTLTLP